MRDWRNLALAMVTVATLVACKDDVAGTDGATDTEGDTDPTGTTGTTFGGETGDTTGTAETGGTTGIPGDALEPCDPRSDQCNEGVCAGAAQAGFYCRPTCSSTAAPGDECSGGVCLPAWQNSNELACIELTDCDPFDGSGCGAGESCVVMTYNPLRTACVPSGDTGAGMQCDPAFMHDCDLGLACLGSDLDGDDPGICTAWCQPGGALPDGCSQCVPITDEIGACAECSVIANDCPDGSECQPINEVLGGICVDHGPGAEGDPCDFATSCQQGLLCLETDVDDAFACVQKCDPTNPMCDDEAKSCIDVAQIVPGPEAGQLGVCIETDVVLCDPDADPSGCRAGDLCLEIQPGVGLCAASCDPTTGDAACEGNFACLPALDEQIFGVPFAVGNGACGQACSADVDCGGGNTCLLLDGVEADGVCGTTCDPAGDECLAGETCIATAAEPNVGACIADGATCDPTMVDSCLGVTPNAACIPVDGGGSGVCLPACFEQDPAACGGMPDACQVRIDPAFHGGACLGQSTPCDVVAQDCPAPDACSVLGGQALGGAAFICNDPGPLPEGGDCSADADACSLGLECVAGVCRPYCDLGNDQCAAGTCTDISAMFYLPADTVGACL